MSTNPLRPELKWNRFDTLVALTVALLAIVSALLFYLPRSQSGVLTVVVTVSGQEIQRTPLSEFTAADVEHNGYTLHPPS